MNRVRRALHRPPPRLVPAMAGLLAAGVACGAEPAEPVEAGDVWEAVSDGTVDFSARYRLEHVDQDGLGEEALASNLDATLGYRTRPWLGLAGYLQFENVSRIGEENFNDTVNGLTDHPVVADPEGAEVNQAYLAYEGGRLPGARLAVGRQAINLDDQRFVGQVAWRLNDQTFDAATVAWDGIERLSLLGGYVWNVNTILGTDRTMEGGAILLNAAYAVEGYGTATGYAYLLDFEAGQGTDSATLGARFAGDRELDDDWTLSYEADLARQGAYADTDDFEALRYHLAVGAAWRWAALTIGYEVLGSDDGVAAFQTPLGTNHAFNGWADRFLTTPADGLRDLFVRLAANCPAVEGLKGSVAYHVFSSDEDDRDYGTEIDVVATWAWDHGLSFGLKAASYDAEDFATDTTKLWGWAAYAF